MSQLLLPLDLPQMESARMFATPSSAMTGGLIRNPEEVEARYRREHGRKRSHFGNTLLRQALMSSAAASPARTFPVPERVPGLTASAAAYGASSPVSLANYDPDTSSWRTSQRSFLEGWTVFSQTWPRSGTMRNGTAYRLPPLVPLTDATGSGSWPTPTASDQNCASLTPEARTRPNGICLADAARRMWPTPRAIYGEHPGMKSLEHLTGQALMWPTPTADRYSGLQSHGQNAILGSLNPNWVEWLMGYPSGWTDLKA